MFGCRLPEPLGREQAGVRRTAPVSRSSTISGRAQAEAVEGDVVGHPDRVDAEQPGDRGDRAGVDHTVLEAVVERVQQIHRARRCRAAAGRG